MAVYKVIQDIEAEDKIVGFLTLKTFIYAMIAAALAYINVRLLIAGSLGPIRFFFILILLLPMMLFGVLSAPLGRDQPTEVWLLSHVRFYLKKRKRVWDQSGAQELVTITAPKKVERNLTKNLSQTEVQSRLKALATTLDSRGWAVKNVAINLSTNPGYLDIEPEESDRLISASAVSMDQPVLDIHASDDIMDEQNNPTAQHFESLMQEADERRRRELLNKVNQAKLQGDSEFLDRVATDSQEQTKFVGHKIVSPGEETKDETSQVAATSEEAAFLDNVNQRDEEVRARSASFKPKASQVESDASTPDSPAVTQDVGNAKLKELIEVAKHDKLSTLAKEAGREKYQIKQTAPGEVEIDLH